ncbi:hypothetical protein FOA52_012310 [Chlamydomonas sp. UWO 241]|nr:hypothetical protein FOA52_012310 [Chlamydomonas sp. UWO 241]
MLPKVFDELHKCTDLEQYVFWDAINRASAADAEVDDQISFWGQMYVNEFYKVARLPVLSQLGWRGLETFAVEIVAYSNNFTRASQALGRMTLWLDACWKGEKDKESGAYTPDVSWVRYFNDTAMPAIVVLRDVLQRAAVRGAEWQQAVAALTRCINALIVSYSCAHAEAALADILASDRALEHLVRTALDVTDGDDTVAATEGAAADLRDLRDLLMMLTAIRDAINTDILDHAPAN